MAVTSINTKQIKDSTILNEDVDPAAAIAGTKIVADFGAQDLIVDTSVLMVDATNNRVGVNTAIPSANFHVVGSIRIVDGTEGLGKVFTSDANGVGTWAPPAGGGGTATIDGIYVYISGSLSLRTTPGLATINGINRYVAALGGLDVTPASTGNEKIGILQVDTSKIFSTKYSEYAALHGRSTAATPTVDSLSPGGDININVDSDGVQTVTLSSNGTAEAIAQDIQSKVRALIAVNPANQSSLDNFIVVGSSSRYIWSQDSTGSSYLYKIKSADGSILNTFGPYSGIGQGFMLAIGDYIWISAFTGNLIYRILVADGSVINSSASTAAQPWGLAYDGSNVWITCNASSNNLGQYDASSGALLNTYTPGGTFYTDVIYDSGSLWIVCQGDQTIKKVSTIGGLLASYPVTGASGIRGLVSDGTYLWISDFSNSKLYKMSMATGALSGPYATGANPRMGVVFGANIWVVASGANAVQKFRLSDGVLLATYSVTFPSFGGNIITDDVFLFAGSGGNTIKKIDPSSGSYVSYTVGLSGQYHLVDGINHGGFNLISGGIGSSSSVVVTDAPVNNVANILKLGVANGGSEVTGAAGSPPSYPSADANNLVIANIGSGTFPIFAFTTRITDDDIHNDVTGRP